jgi:predicted PurR-regulated permease PerM
MNLPELISPERANQLVLWAAIALSVLGAALGFWAAKARGLVAILAGPLVFLLWQGHQWITRYDPQSGYFGLNKVWVLALEVVIFVALGALCGWIWNRVIAPGKQGK